MNVLIGAYLLLFSMKYDHDRVLCHYDSIIKIQELVAKANELYKWDEVRLTPTTHPSCKGQAGELTFHWTGSPWKNYRQSEAFRTLAQEYDVQILRNRYTMEANHSDFTLAPALVMAILASIFLRIQRRKARWIEPPVPRLTVKWSFALGIVGGGFAFVSALPFILTAASPEFSLLTYPAASSFELGWTAIIAFVIAIPVFEEIIFRGWLLEAWSRLVNPVVALIVSSILFSAIHPAGLLINSLLLLCGMIFGLLWLQTRSVAAPIAAHSTYNAMVLFLT